jgi:hypothetical protein
LDAVEREGTQTKKNNEQDSATLFLVHGWLMMVYQDDTIEEEQ